MGSISDCCVSDESKRTRHEYEGSQNTDTLPTDPLILSTDDPSNDKPAQTQKSAQQHNTLSNAEGYTDSGPESVHSSSSASSSSKTAQRTEAIKESLTKQTTIIASPPPSNGNGLSLAPESDHEQQSDTERAEKATNKWRIVVTQPLSPRRKLQGPTKSFEYDDHPYSLHKRVQKLLAMGYVRRFNVSSMGPLPLSVLNLVFDFYYFHYADCNSQMSILEDAEKQQKSMALITSENETDEDLAKFLDTILRSKLAEKMWNKFDSDLKGVIETDKIVQFLILPVILYKSTLHHRQTRARGHSRSGSQSRKSGQISKPNLDKKAIKADVEHLAIWILRNYGEQQPDNSYHFILTKEDYMSGKLAVYIEHYIQHYFE
mmetsp:Transcript_44388/g.71102  ORF Transcript_44388/g.71102 Transcript_44388/m.71102 type:complete len:374 (+) Transcript_44388:34-1155(+)